LTGATTLSDCTAMQETQLGNGGANKPDILFLAHRVPYPPDKGDRIRTFHILRFLARRAAVHLLCLADEPISDDVSVALGSICRRFEIVPLGKKMRWVRALSSLVRGRTASQGAFYSSEVQRVVRGWSTEVNFKAAMVSASSMSPYLRSADLRSVPALVDMVDVDSQKWLDYSGARRWPLSWLFRTEGRRLRLEEKEMCQWARAVTLVSEAEADLCRSFAPSPQIHAVTNGVDLDYFQSAGEQATHESCVFVGALDYYPNVDAAVSFCKEVWPAIHRTHPEATFLLVGRCPTTAVERLAELPGVKLVGQVPDVRPYLAKATVVVVPLRIARGLQNKVLEALAMGKPVVASPAALAALRCQSGVHLLAASSREEWIKCVTNMLEDQDLGKNLGAAGRKFVEEHHNWDRCLRPLTKLLGITDYEMLAGRNRDCCP
jgi:sugar transferase (PEP-CTERM/EpsH1 system associated)